MKKIGIITFHNSYNCGSMLESFAMQEIIKKRGGKPEIVNFSAKGQKELYSVFFRNNSLKNIFKNIMIFPHVKKINNNNKMYEKFKNDNFILSSNQFEDSALLHDDEYSKVVAGSDQIWNITIPDSDDAYFLPWVNKAKKIAYAPSFGAKNIMDFSNDIEKYKNYLLSFESLSVRENNGKKWIKELCGRDAEVLLDPTLLLEREDYDKICDNSYTPKEKFIFLYCPAFNRKVCEYVKKISDKYKLNVVAWSTKSFYFKGIRTFGFKLVPYESPALYLNLIKNAEIVITTSFHGTIFSTIYRKKFITVKNGDMYGNDDRVITLLKQLKLEDRLLPYEFEDNYDYLQDIDYKKYDEELNLLKKKSINYIDKNIIE